MKLSKTGVFTLEVVLEVVDESMCDCVSNFNDKILRDVLAMDEFKLATKRNEEVIDSVDMLLKATGPVTAACTSLAFFPCTNNDQVRSLRMSNDLEILVCSNSLLVTFTIVNSLKFSSYVICHILDSDNHSLEWILFSYEIHSQARVYTDRLTWISPLWRFGLRPFSNVVCLTSVRKSSWQMLKPLQVTN